MMSARSFVTACKHNHANVTDVSATQLSLESGYPSIADKVLQKRVPGCVQS